MSLSGKWTTILNQIETDLKSITELQDDGTRARVQVGRIQAAFKSGDYEALVAPAAMLATRGITNKTTWNDFTIFVDVLYCSSQTDSFADAFKKGLDVAEKVYDKFHLTSIGGTVRKCTCSIELGEGFVADKNIDAIPVRVTINAEVPITQ